jgi:asparagine synthase (glutamine-hydrolysing)
MCGIVGIASVRPTQDRAWLSIARDELKHRGPDDAGEWWSDDGKVGLAHRRLSIIDLSSAGQQPMHLISTGISVVFNGEIYNYRELRAELVGLGYKFQSDSDTEVLLIAYHAWGKAFVTRLNGMFAFALHDCNAGELFLARDRAGEKPLFYYWRDGLDFAFSSELKALLSSDRHPRKISHESLSCYLSMGYVPGDRCILHGFNKLPPAHAMIFDLKSGELRKWRYWELPDYLSTQSGHKENDLVDEIEHLLEDSVGKQLVADVPVGILLSGGVDSSLITAMAARHSRNVRTFSITFPNNSRYDESRHARLVANFFGTTHTELVAEPTTAELIPKLAAQFDEPIIDSSMIPTWLVARLVRQQCKVALGGDGGDELFGGYGHHSRILRFASTVGFIPFWLRRLVSKSATNLLPHGFKGRNWLKAIGTDLKSGLPLLANYFDGVNRGRILKQSHPITENPEEIYRKRIPSETDLIQRITRMDFQNYLPEDILVKVDRSSMANSLEIRAPLLDHRIIEFAFNKVPSNLKSDGRDRKILLKKLCKRLLPREFDTVRKQGFGIPLNDWLKSGPFRELFWNILLDKQSIFDRSQVRRLLENQDRGRGSAEGLFGLTLFELWRRHYSLTL